MPVKQVQVQQTKVSRKTSASGGINGNNNNNNYTETYEFVDDGILINDENAKVASKRRASSRTLASTASSTNAAHANSYKSNEVSY